MHGEQTQQVGTSTTGLHDVRFSCSAEACSILVATVLHLKKVTAQQISPQIQAIHGISDSQSYIESVCHKSELKMKYWQYYLSSHSDQVSLNQAPTL